MTYITEITDRLNEELPGNDPDLILLYALLVLTVGENATPVEVHDAWACWRTKTKPDHKDLIPFDDLTEETRQRDWKYAYAIRRIAAWRTAKMTAWNPPRPS